MKLIKTNEAVAARRRMYFDCRDATDYQTPELGEAAGQPQISTDGAAFTNTGIGTLTHMGNGRYYADLTQAAVNITAGSEIRGRYKSANTRETPADEAFQIVAYDPNDVVTAIQNAAGAAVVSVGNAAALTTELVGVNNFQFKTNFTLTGWDASSWTQFCFTIKAEEADEDGAELIRLILNSVGGGDGLKILNRAAAGTAGDGLITVNTATSTDLNLDVLLKAAGFVIPPSGSNNYYYELTQYQTAVKKRVAAGRIKITRATRRGTAAA